MIQPLIKYAMTTKNAKKNKKTSAASSSSLHEIDTGFDEKSSKNQVLTKT